MARSINFANQNLIQPGGATDLIVAGLVPTTPVQGVVGMPGEADGGKPGTLIEIREAADGQSFFGSGDLADAMPTVFGPSNDPQIGGGANKVMAVKVNESSFAQLQLNDPSVEKTTGTDGVSTGSNIFGSSNASSFNEADVGGVLEILTDGSVASTPSVVGRYQIVAVNNDFGSAYRYKQVILSGLGVKVTAGSVGLKYRVFHPQHEYNSRVYGVKGNETSVAFTDGDTAGTNFLVKTARGTTLEQSPNLGGKAALNIQYKGNLVYTELHNDTGGGVGSGTTMVDASGPAAYAANTLYNKFLLMPTTVGSVLNIRKILKHDVLVAQHTFTVGTAFSAAGTSYKIVEGAICTGVVLTATSNSLSVSSTLRDFGLNDFRNLVLVMTSGASSGKRRVITTNAAQTITWSSSEPMTVAATDTFEIHYINSARVSVYGAGGVATKIFGFARLNGNAEETMRSFKVNITEKKTLADVVGEINTPSDFAASVALGMSSKTLASALDYGPQSKNFGVDVRPDTTAANKSVLKADSKAVVDWVNGSSAAVTVTRAAEVSGTGVAYSSITITPTVGSEDSSVDVTVAGWVQVGSKLVYKSTVTGFPVVAGDTELWLVDDPAGSKIFSNQGAFNTAYEYMKLANIVVNSPSPVAITPSTFLSQTVTNAALPICSIGGTVPVASTTVYNLGRQILHGSTALVPTYPVASAGSITTVEVLGVFSPDIVDHVVYFPGVDKSRRIAAVTGNKITFKPALDAAVTAGTVFQISNKGIRGEASEVEWKAAFDLLLTTRVNHVVPLFSEDVGSVRVDQIHEYARDHVNEAAKDGRSERNAYLAYNGTKDQLLAKSQFLNSKNLTLAGTMKLDLKNAEGNIVTFKEWGAAVLAAGMRAGAAIGQSLTHKIANCYGATQSPTWSPTVRRDGDDLTLAGVMFLEPYGAGQFRWVKDTTTYLTDDNITFIQDSAATALNYVTYETRTRLVNKFVGAMAVPFPALPTAPAGRVVVATVGSIKGMLDDTLGGFRNQNIIVDQQDQNTGAIILGYDPRKTTVKISGNVAKVRYSIFIVTGIDFVLVEEFLQIPAQIG